MLDVNIFRLVQEQDFLLRSPLELRPYVWGSLEVYADGVRNRMSRYHSKYDLLHWLSFWTEPQRLASPFAGEELYETLRKQSYAAHQHVLGQLFTTPARKSEPHAGYDIWNAIDGHIVGEQCPDARVVLDFGSGYGRLGAVFADPSRDCTYISVDCVEISYLLQNLFLSSLAPDRFFEYVDYAMERRTFEVCRDKKGSIYHLPSWRLDLVPDGFVDVITSVFVLPEINEFALTEFVTMAKRVVHRGGYVYLRDHLYQAGENNHRGGHRLDTSTLLEEAGFRLIYQGDYQDNVDIYGLPRVYRKDG